MEGWIKIHRKILDWEWYQDKYVFSVFIHLLLTANYENKRWQGIEVKQGQIITSVQSLLIGLNKNPKNPQITTQNIRTALTKLKSTNEITIKTTSKYTIITINKYKDYQEVTNKVTNNQQTTNKQLTTTKEYKNIKNIRNKTYTSENLSLEQVAEKINQAFNIYLGRKFKGIDSFKNNLEYWLEIYEPKEIARAIENSKYDSFFKDKLTPVLLFRRKNPRGENVDYISQLLINSKNDNT